MGLEYDVEQLPEKGILERIRELQIALAPRNQCYHYVATRTAGTATLMTKKEFDKHNGNDFSEGPYKDSFGSGYGEPYNPHRQAFGMLKSGVVVYAELSESFQSKTDELFRSMASSTSEGS